MRATIDDDLLEQLAERKRAENRRKRIRNLIGLLALVLLLALFWFFFGT
jgi:hypothetical protein